MYRSPVNSGKQKGKEQMNYEPDPIDNSKIALPEDLLELKEKLSENIHDVWGRKRISEGWKYGPMRDDVNKTHPCLVPYEDLPEQEKEYDRAVAAETIKAIIALGYKIEKL